MAKRSLASRLTFRGQLFLVLTFLIAVAVGALTAYFLRLDLNVLRTASEQKAEMLKHSVEQKAAALARNGALLSVRAAATMDFAFLQQTIDATVREDKQIRAALIANAKGRVVVHSDKKKIGQLLKGDWRARPDLEVSTRETTLNGAAVLEASAAIMTGKEQWGTMQYSLSLENVERETALAARQLAQAQRRTVMYSVAAGGALWLVALLLATLGARKIVRPVKRLAASIQDLMAGREVGEVQATSPLEMVRLAQAFNAMLGKIKERDHVVYADLRKLKLAVEKAQQAERTKEHFLSRVSGNILEPLERVEHRLGESRSSGFKTVTVFTCPKCHAAFEAEPGDEKREHLPCPDCGAQMNAAATPRINNPGEQKKRLKEIETLGNQLLALVNEILDFSKLEAEWRRINVHQLDVRALVRAAQEKMSGTPAGKQLIWPSNNITCQLEGDRTRMEQALSTVVELVCNLTRDQQAEIRLEVDVCTYKGEAGVQFVVRESGAGIAPEHLDALKAGSSPDVRQTINMMILRQIADAHSGEFSLESDMERGVTARFVVPQHHVAEAL